MLALPFATLQELADLLNVNRKAIIFYAFTKKGQSSGYRKFKLPKRGGGVRLITSPDRGLYIIQRAILDKILTPEMINNRSCVFSYTWGKTAQDMAARHVRREFVVRVDIENFFGRITFPRVLGALKAFPLRVPHNWAVIIAQLCTCDGVLPQGAPTSPAISNLIARRMDGELIRFAREHGFRYSRYSDDLVFSGKTRRNLLALVEQDRETFSYVAAEPLRSIVEANSFRLNNAKTRVAFRQQKQIVVGSIVNKKVNVDRRYVRQIRTLLHLSGKSPDDALKAHHEWSGKKGPKDISKVLRGKIEHIRNTKGSADSVFTTMAETFNKTFVGVRPIEIGRLIERKASRYTEQHVLVCQGFHRNYGSSIAHGGNDAVLYKTGSCFFLEGIGLVTAFHTLSHTTKVFSANNPAFDFDISDAILCDPIRDIALLDGSPILRGFYRPLRPETTREVVVGESIAVLGYPHYTRGDRLSHKTGKITQFKERFGMTLYAVDIALEEGDSGGAVVNDRGHVIGLVRSMATDHFVTPIDYVLERAKHVHTPKPIVNWEADFIGFGARADGEPGPQVGQIRRAANLVMDHFSNFVKFLRT
ncbi:MAG: reverse transcriptase domain-containing protein [Kiloniellaceae bacterium]